MLHLARLSIWPLLLFILRLDSLAQGPSTTRVQVVCLYINDLEHYLRCSIAACTIVYIKINFDKSKMMVFRHDGRPEKEGELGFLIFYSEIVVNG